MSTIIYSKNTTSDSFEAAAKVPQGIMIRIYGGKVNAATPDTAQETQTQLMKRNPDLLKQDVLAITFADAGTKPGFGQTASEGVQVHSVVLSPHGVESVKHPVVLTSKTERRRPAGFCN